MRRLMNLVVAIGLMGAGLYVLYEELFVRYPAFTAVTSLSG